MIWFKIILNDFMVTLVRTSSEHSEKSSPSLRPLATCIFSFFFLIKANREETCSWRRLCYLNMYLFILFLTKSKWSHLLWVVKLVLGMAQKSNRKVESPTHDQANQLGSLRALRPLDSSLKQRSRGWVGSVLPAASQLLCCQES